MKKITYLSSLVLLLLATSCGGGGTKPKEIKPTTSEFRSGELARYIEVEDEPSELTFSEVDGAIPTQYIRLKVPVKLVKDGFKDVDPRDISFTSLIGVAYVDLVDENGSKVKDLSLKSDDYLKLQKLLTQEEGSTETLVFEGQYSNHDVAPKWFEGAVSYTPTLTAGIQIENSSASSGTKVEEESEVAEAVTSDEDDSQSSYSSNSSSQDAEFDEFLASYEKYIDKYIALMKKAKNGDYSAMADAASMMSDAQEYAEKLQKVSGNLTPAQLAKFQKLQQKLINAAK